jgi:hypothetical protein
MTEQTTEVVPLKREHYTFSVRIPKEWIDELGMAMASEVVVEKIGSNPLGWEIRIKPQLRKEVRKKPR